MKTRLGRRLWLFAVLAMVAAALVPSRTHAQTAVSTQFTGGGRSNYVQTQTFHP